jgi:hypothetical protein
MAREHDLASQASRLSKILLQGSDSEILERADEILLFLNQLQDFIRQNPKSKIILPSMSDIIDGLESDPDATLKDKNVYARLLVFFVKVAQQF